MVAVLRERPEDAFGMAGDAATFAISCLLLLGVYYPASVLKAIGDTSMFLIIAGVGGLIYAIRAIFKA